MSYVCRQNSKDSRLYHMTQQQTMSTSNSHRCLRINLITWLLLQSVSNLLKPAYISAAPSSRIRLTNNNADNTRERHYHSTFELFQQQHTRTMIDNEDFTNIVSPNFISIHQSEATSFGSEVVRRTQSNAACSANPECAAAGLADDCCPTSAGMFLMCCSQTTPPGEFGFLIQLNYNLKTIWLTF